jgi:hypothetical protein
MSEQVGLITITAWWCEECHASGLLEMAEREGVWSSIGTLMEAHEQHALSRAMRCQSRGQRVRATIIEPKEEAGPR